MNLMEYPAIVTTLVAFVSSLVLVPIVRACARQLGIVDRPDAERKLHEHPISLAGGVAVFGAMCIAIFTYVSLYYGLSVQGFRDAFTQRWLVLFGAAAAILVVGLIDDIWNMRGRQKLLAQCFIAMVIVGAGTSLRIVGVFGYDIPLGIFALPISVLWLLLAINALNLLDGADGMASTVGMFVAASLAILSILNHGLTLNAVAAIGLAGALAGFLVFNRPPATIFLGDAGSMMIGLVIGVLSMWCSLKGSTLVAAAPIAILVLPLFDSAVAIIRRWMTGRSLYVTDRGHLHHRLREKFGPVGMLLIVALACSVSSAVAIAATIWDYQWLAPIGALLVLGALIFTRTFGHSESRLIATRLWHLLLSFFVRQAACETERQERRVQLQGDGPWREIWEPLVRFAESQELSRVKIDVNMAWLHEGYHGNWQSVRLPEKAFQNIVKVPLFAERIADGESERVPIGKLEIVAPSTHDSFVKLADFLEQAEELQEQVQLIVAKIEEQQHLKSQASKTAATTPVAPASQSRLKEETVTAS